VSTVECGSAARPGGAGLKPASSTGDGTGGSTAWEGRDARLVSLDKSTGATSGKDSEGTLGEGDSGVTESWRAAPFGFLGAKLGCWTRRPRCDVDFGRKGEWWFDNCGVLSLLATLGWSLRGARSTVVSVPELVSNLARIQHGFGRLRKPHPPRTVRMVHSGPRRRQGGRRDAAAQLGETGKRLGRAWRDVAKGRQAVGVLEMKEPGQIAPHGSEERAWEVQVTGLIGTPDQDCARRSSVVVGVGV
jgi:hypothetical protein